MAHYSDWLPAARDAILAMAKAWLLIITTKLQAWGIPESVFQNFSTLTAKAESNLEMAKSESTRTPVVTAQCKESFDTMIAAMRDMKKRYFLSPPLNDADFVALGIKPPDTTHSPTGTPTAQVMVETFLVGRHELGIRIIYITGSSNEPANKGYRIWYSVLDPGGVPPAEPEDLRKSFFTKRKKDLVQFEYGDSGKTVYIAVRVENTSGKQGPWGPMVSTLIP